MIFDKIQNFKLYAGVHPRFEVARKFFADTKLETLTTGRHELDDGVVLIVEDYRTRLPADCGIECHRKNIDIQLLARGSERIGVVARTECKANPYDDSKDYQQLFSDRMDFITLAPGSFAVFFPDDGHSPCGAIDGSPTEVRKLVFKVPV
ncbi:MAG: YhcH/YjgK/YiaL family protein [Planctomycetes bacterium]|nr:YhcH/YjgK/YiaL family protein [Planctomycetota bacterium]